MKLNVLFQAAHLVYCLTFDELTVHGPGEKAQAMHCGGFPGEVDSKCMNLALSDDSQQALL